MTPLCPYQYEGAKQIHRFGGRALLADEMGLGKTLQVLYYAWRTQNLPMLVACPASLKWNWEREASRHLSWMSEVLDGTRIPRGLRPTNHPVIIVNYDILRHWLPYIRKLGVQTLVIDEAHYIKNRRSGRYQTVSRLAKRIPHVIALSGTPLTNNPVELWPTLNVVCPGEFGMFLDFAFRYTRPKRLAWGWEFKTPRRLDELHARLKSTCMIRRRKQDVLHDLPPKQRVVVPMDIANRSEYEEASTNFIRWLSAVDAAGAERAKRAEQLTKIGYLLRLCAKSKVPMIQDWIDNYLLRTDQKLVVFTMYRKMVEILHERYHGMSVVVDGSVTGKNRMRAVDQFQHAKSCRLFIGNIRAAGVGLTLTKAPVCAFTDLPWTPGDLVQGEDRIHRIGQTQAVSIYYLVAVRTIEERLCELLVQKQEILESTLDGTGRGDNLDIFKELLGGFRLKP